MFRLISAFGVAALFTAFAVDRPANGEDSTVLALSTDRTIVTEPAARAPSLDDFAGVYQTADGATFVVVRNGDTLTVEIPETMALPIRAAGPGFVLDSSVVRIAFETDGGNVRMLVTRGADGPMIATRMSLPRGVVTVHDI